MLKSVSETNQLFEIRVKFLVQGNNWNFWFGLNPQLTYYASNNNPLPHVAPRNELNKIWFQFILSLIFSISFCERQDSFMPTVYYSKLRWNGMLIKLRDLTHKRWIVLVARKHVAQIFFYRIMTQWYSRNKMLLCLCHYERGKLFAQEKAFHLSMN